MNKLAKRASKNNVLLIVILSVLVLIIIGWAVWLAFIFLGEKEVDGGETGTYPQSMHSPSLEEINELAKTLPESQARALYLEAIDNATSKAGRSEARVEYGRYLFAHGYDSEMLDQFGQVDEDAIDAGYKILLYSSLVSYYGALGDKPTSDAYNDMLKEVIKDSNYAAGG